MAFLGGQFLVASPHLPDSNFFRSVVLIIQHDSEGAFGLILNRPTGSTVAEVWEMLSKDHCDCMETVNHGGPVEGPLMALHGDELFSEEEVLEGVHFAVDQENLEHLVREATAPFRIFSGYAGWAGGQLESELEAGGWLTTTATSEEVFAGDEELWSLVSGRIGLEILKSSLKPKHVPSDPTLN